MAYDDSRWIIPPEDDWSVPTITRTCLECRREFSMPVDDEYQMHVICSDCERERRERNQQVYLRAVRNWFDKQAG